MASVKWLLVGAGQIAGSRVARALAEAAGSELVAVCDVDRARTQELAGRFGVSRVHEAFDEALTRSGADAVYLSVPVNLHASMGVAALEAGKHLLVEKPLALNGAQARALAAAAGASPKVSACAFYRRLSGQFQFTRKALASGEIGRVVGGLANYTHRLSESHVAQGRWYLRKAVAGGGLLCHLGAHVVDVIVGLTGAPRSVVARCGQLRQGLDVEDYASLVLTLANGAPFSLNLNWNANAARHDFEILGSDGAITWPEWPPHGDAPVVVSHGKETRQEVTPNCRDNWHLPLVEDFLAAVRDGRPVACSIAEAATTNAVIDAAYRSSAEGRSVEVEPV